VLIARSDFPANTFKELLAYARANQDRITMADAGPGGPSSLCGLLFMSATGTKLTAVPYKGTAPALQAYLKAEMDKWGPLIRQAGLALN
jgi:tripartite-type tricarboxylate transporter receptor subunit TctC